ncbi:hypothetical protein N7462_003124 [Penicillium macrosclerotiorum]|uniref:uncharacterized protein n=1 Tax=Penicillium macrosclerotiorum TaxID=303699 RepID=UPI002548C671|nr:uncharacterized protein N7462_003124 [Penicillium macrosclerotiorum]KAJ5688732.1 hypothetical protein N7462_003124 [Penicillium macrosclerotiorum]
MTGVRNRRRVDGIPQGEYRGWTHIVNIVKLASGQKYHVDVAFGGDGPTWPIPLILGQTFRNLGSQEIRLSYDNIPNQTCPAQKFWVYQYRNGPEKEWNSFYAFAEFEFFHNDFEVINHYTSWEALTKKNLWIVKFIRNGETYGLPLNQGDCIDRFSNDVEVSVVGKLIFIGGSPDVVKLNMGGKSRIIDSFKTEEERVQGLQKWFGIHI